AQAEESDRLRAQADEARSQNEQAAQQVEAAKKQAAQAHRLADAQAREAELARKEAELLAASGAKPAPSAAAAAQLAGPLTLAESAFAPGKAQLQAGAKAQIARIVASAAGKSVYIEAHADDAGNAKANAALAQQRAQAVREALVAAGVPAGHVTMAG